MSIVQALIGGIVSSGSGGGGGTPTAYAGYGASPTEGYSTDITIYVNNWDGSRIWWSVVGKGSPAADPNTDMLGTLSGFYDPGSGSTSAVVTTIEFTIGSTEGTEYWGVNLGTTDGASDIWNGDTWSITEPFDYNDWTIEWFQKSNPSQPSQFPRVFGIATYPSQPIGFSMEGTYYGWVSGTGIAANASVTHNAWQHWVMVTNGFDFSMYRNGIRVANSPRANYGEILNTTASLYVGIDSSSANGYKGLVTNFRVVKGQAMYDPTQTTISVPRAPLLSNSNTELLLRATDGSSIHTDSSSRVRIPWGTGSNAFSTDTPFTAAGPYTQYTNQSGSGGDTFFLTFTDANYNADLLNVTAGWTVSVGGNVVGTVIGDAIAVSGSIIDIPISVNLSQYVAGTFTFTQPALGGSIEFYTSSYGFLGYTAGTEWAFDGPSSTYALNFAGGNIVNEGSEQILAVGGTNVIAGTYYWTIETNAGDFATTSGEVTVTGGSGLSLGTFSVIPTEDATTEGDQTFTVALRSGSVTGTILAISPGITINDTSLTPIVRLTSGTALGFNGTDNRHVIVADNLADWNLGDNWTIEWWQKIPVDASGFLSILCQDANVPTYSGIDVFVNAGSICMFNGGLQVSEAPATRGEWNHIAIQNSGTTLAAYINGIARSVSGSHSGTISPSSPLNVVIGSRTADGGANFYGQYFNGQLSNIRISDIARYTGTFTVPTTVEYDANTKLALDGSVGSSGMLVDETGRHTLTNNSATVDTIV